MKIKLDQLKQLEEFELLDDNITFGSNLDSLGLDVSSLTKPEISLLLALLQENSKARIAGQQLMINLRHFTKTAPISLEQALVAAKVADREQIFQLFGNTVVTVATEAAEELESNFLKYDSILFNGVLSKIVTTVLKAVLKFRQEVDRLFPGLIDTALTVANILLSGLVMVSCPAAGIILQASGILDKAQNFLSCESLQKTINRLEGIVAEVDKEPVLATAYRKAKLVEALTARVNGLPGSLQQILVNENISGQAIQLLERSIDNPAAKEFAKALTKISTIVPQNIEDAELKLSILESNIIKIIDQQDLTPELKKQAKQAIYERFQEIAPSALDSFDTDKSFPQKLASYRETISLLTNITKDISRALPDNRVITHSINSEVQKLVEQQITKPIEQLKEKTVKTPPEFIQAVGFGSTQSLLRDLEQSILVQNRR